MPLPLTSALLDQILFAMEDQDNFSVLNLTSRQVEVCADENSCGDNTVLPLPSWSSTDGFRMMREFSESLHNPSVQAELRAVLDSGQGVFRRFKLVLKPRDLLYRQWLRFKRKFMEEKVRQWLEDWPEVVYEDPAEPAFGADEPGLLAADFTFREGQPAEAGRLEDWDAEACHEAAQSVFGENAEPAYDEYFRRGRRYGRGDRYWVAENPQRQWAGVIWGRLWAAAPGPPGVIEVQLWFVDPEYRGLGLGSRLLETMREAYGPGPALLLVTPVSDRRLDGPLVRSGFLATGRLWVASGRPPAAR
jgi:ribosomal protein S18 acetylase RimI-like enzyme